MKNLKLELIYFTQIVKQIQIIINLWLEDLKKIK